MVDQNFIKTLIILSGLFTVYFFMLLLTLPSASVDNYIDYLFSLFLFMGYGIGVIFAGFLFMGLIAEF